MSLQMTLVHRQKNPQKPEKKECIRTLLIGSQKFVESRKNSLCRSKHCIDTLVIFYEKEQRLNVLQQIQFFAKKTKTGAYKKVICDTGLSCEKEKKLHHDIEQKLGELVFTSIRKPTVLEWEQFPSMILLKSQKKNFKLKGVI